MAADFARWKESRLQGEDFSKKGSIDEPIKELINYINSLDQYFTTSSCSGRVVMFAEEECRKVGCKWVFVSHNIIEQNSLLSAADASLGDLVVKFEPFILHVQCQNVSSAQLMNQAAIESGFRNSGLTLGKSGKIMVAVRGSQSLEVPITSDNRLVVQPEYLQFLATKVNEKFEENTDKIHRFFVTLQKCMVNYEDTNSEVTHCQNGIHIPRKTRRKKVAVVPPLYSSEQCSNVPNSVDESSINSDDILQDLPLAFL